MQKIPGCETFIEGLRRRVKNILSTLKQKVDRWIFEISHLKYSGLISVILPVYNSPQDILIQCIESVLNQTYNNWQLCIVDDASTMHHVKPLLLKFALNDRRIKLVFSEKNEGIAASINKAAKLAKGKYLGVLDHDDELSPDALLEFSKMIRHHPDADLLYCDEDKIDEKGSLCEPWLKSDWNPDLSLSFNYVMHFALYRRNLFTQIGGVRKAFEGSQDYDLLLRVADRKKNIYHIPKILYHWRKGPGSIASGPEAKDYVFDSGIAALEETLQRRHIEGTAEHAPDAWKGVYRVRRSVDRSRKCAVLIYSAGESTYLRSSIESVTSHIQNPIELLVCCHSVNFAEVNSQVLPEGNAQVVVFEGADTPAEAFNAGAEKTEEDILFLLDEKMDLMSPESFDALLEHIQRPEIGAVGGKVYYENGLVEHGGIIFGPFNLLGYAHRATPDTPGYAGLKNMIGNFSAVMGLGMMTRKSLLQKVGGFDRRFGAAYWDADFCLRLREHKFLITYTPYARFIHHIPVKTIPEMIVEPEATHFRERWQQIIDNDPYFNPGFSRELESFSVPENTFQDPDNS